MIITIPAGKKSVTLVDTSADCRAIGVKMQSLDGNGVIYVSTDQALLDGPLNPTTNHPRAGIFLQLISAPTNVPSIETWAPIKGALFARNFGAADSDLSVDTFAME